MMMKKSSILIVFLILAWNSTGYSQEKFDFTDKILLTSSLVLLTEDWRQSRYISENPNDYREQNFILGDHPDKSDVDLYFGISTIAVCGIAYILPSKYRKWWLSAVVVTEGYSVLRNNHVGVGIRW